MRQQRRHQQQLQQQEEEQQQQRGHKTLSALILIKWSWERAEEEPLRAAPVGFKAELGKRAALKAINEGSNGKERERQQQKGRYGERKGSGACEAALSFAFIHLRSGSASIKATANAIHIRGQAGK